MCVLANYAEAVRRVCKPLYLGWLRLSFMRDPAFQSKRQAEVSQEQCKGSRQDPRVQITFETRIEVGCSNL